MKAEGPEAGAMLLTQKALGLEIASFKVFGINSLKTLVAPDALVGAVVTSASTADEKIDVAVGSRMLQVDLQRTGAIVWTGPGEATPRQSTITGIVTFVDGSAAAFVEPAKTKRIAFWVTEGESTPRP